MEADAVSATIGILVQNLIDLSKNEISPIRDLKKKADDLNDTLGMIQGVLNDAQKKSITDEAVRKWLKQLQDVAFEADNVLDALHYRLLSNKRKTIKREEEKKKAPSCFPSFSRYINQRQMALQIKEINTRFESIGNKATKLGLQEIFAAAPDAAPASLETDSFTDDPIFIGRDNEVLEIVEMLTTCPTEEKVSILPVVGMGGMGKTTLVRNVFNHEKIKTHFQQHIWVHVSQDFDAVAIFEKILKNMQESNIKDENRQGLLMKLQEALSNKTYILVLDDVWNQDSEKWNDFKNSWSGITSTKGNAILVTTRNKKVGTIVGTLDIHELKGLSEEECWSIIKSKALKGRDSPPIGPEVETIGRSIAKRCQGLPLAANVVGGVLRHKSHDQWLPIKDKWLSDEEVGGDGNNITKILKLSFHHLSSPSLKNCFAYCSIFPKGARIDRVELIELWMAEGFLQSAQTSDRMENEGDKFFNLLLQNSLLQVLHRDKYGEIEYCSMHDLVHDLAGSVNHEGMYRARYRKVSSRIPEEQAKWLRTLLYDGEISNIIFSDFKSLHALTLMDYNVDELPNSIRELVHLRYLDISETVIERLPESIGELYHLQTFSACSTLQKFPSTFKYLFNLRHLHAKYFLRKLPPHMGMLTFLQTLPFFKVGEEKGHRIEELGSLKNLKGKLRIDNLEKVNGEDESKKAYLLHKPGIVELVLIWSERIEGRTINDENVLSGLQPHPNLKILKIKGFGGVSLPSWTLKMERLNKLVEIKLESCYHCEEIPTLGHLPNLKSLDLYGLKNVKCIGSSFYGMDNCSSNPHGVCKETIISVFPALEKLKLVRMKNLIEWEEVEIPSGAQVKVFPSLQFLEIDECKKLKNICETRLTSLLELRIVKLGELTCLPDGLFYNSQSLSLLEIRNCPKLKEFPEDLQTFNSLQEFKIKECPNMRSIPYNTSGRQSGGFTMLRKLSIWDCQQLKKFSTEVVESLSPLLEKLELQLGNTTNMTKLIECLSKMCRLTDLKIEIVPQVITTSPAAACTLPDLQYLTIRCKSAGNLNSGDSVSSCLNEVADGILRLSSHSLVQLKMIGMEDWECLPDQLQHLTALSSLTLSGFGMEELPEWFGNFSSLFALRLSECRKLKHLPSSEEMRRLTRLYHLIIDGCPLLRERCIEQKSGDKDSEWPKISHITYIQFDGHYLDRRFFL